ncbi:MAG: hypothetical protein JNK15_25940, partial [Planctomycetes bacterium]|nr:hypothetical protein [Planctomycetota bacterium]
MPRPFALAAVLATASLTFAQTTNDARPQPVTLVGQAEKSLQQRPDDAEGAILMLWQALDLLATANPDPVQVATTLSARDLLRRCDPLEPERRRVFASVGKQQVELAAAYRAKKWLDVAADRLGVADRYDADVGLKERAAIEAARPKPKAGTPAPAPANKEPDAPRRSPMLQRANTGRILGEWREVDDCLES